MVSNWHWSIHWLLNCCLFLLKIWSNSFCKSFSKSSSTKFGSSSKSSDWPESSQLVQKVSFEIPNKKTTIFWRLFAALAVRTLRTAFSLSGASEIKLAAFQNRMTCYFARKLKLAKNSCITWTWVASNCKISKLQIKMLEYFIIAL